jgi:hypothetical protein
MRYLRLFSALLLSTFAITGCHRRRAQVLPPPQAQAPIVATLPPIPPLTFPDVQIAKPKPPPTIVHVAPPPPPPKIHKERVHHHRSARKAEIAAAEPPDSTTIAARPYPESSKAADSASSTPAVGNGASVLGQLSADDPTATPHENLQTKGLIEYTEDRLKKIPHTEKAEHKDAIAQVTSFLAQAKQALGMNDVVGAQTLANKAKILLDELLK